MLTIRGFNLAKFAITTYLSLHKHLEDVFLVADNVDSVLQGLSICATSVSYLGFMIVYKTVHFSQREVQW